MTAPFTLEELLEALHVAPQIKLEEFRSSEEWARILGVSRARMRALIGEGLRQRRVEHRNVYRTCIDGRNRLVPVYRFILKEGEG